LAEYQGGLRRWFKEQWVDISRPKAGGGYAACGRPTEGMSARDYQRKYPKCVPARVASRMSSEQKSSAIRRKRKAESQVARDGKKPIMVSTFKKSYEGIADTIIFKYE
jgi:hypothetical protein